MKMENAKYQLSVMDFSEETNGRRVLIVEDDLVFGPIWEHILLKAGQIRNMDWAVSVKQAERMIGEAQSLDRPYDLIVSDIFLSGKLTGIDLWHQVQNIFQERFVLVSSSDPVKIFKDFNGSGSPSYLQKPLILSEAINTIYGLLQKEI